MHLGTEHKEGDFSDEEVCRDTDYLTVSQVERRVFQCTRCVGLHD